MQHFYDGQIRRYITQVIRLMSNFSYKDGDGALRTIPVMYGDMTRQVSHIIRDNSENKLPSVSLDCAKIREVKNFHRKQLTLYNCSSK